MKLLLAITVALTAVTGSLAGFGSGPLCPDLLTGWWSEGCTLDSADACAVDPVGSAWGGLPGTPYNTIPGCGWGNRKHYYDCGVNDVRDCDFFCYKPCPGEQVSNCNDLGLDLNNFGSSGCDAIVFKGECTEHCGVGRAHFLWLCDGIFTTCYLDCCCDRCTGGSSGEGGNYQGDGKRCDDENMALPSLFPEWCCPAHQP